MALEMTAIRVLAPFFGTSAFIWAMIIGVVMVLITLGSLAGGRAADKKMGIGRLCELHLVAAVLTTLTSQGLTLLLYATFDKLPHTAPVLMVATFISVIVISAPVFLFSFTSPWLIGELSAPNQNTGSLAGKIYGLGTLGGLLGTFLPVLFLVPIIGSRFTFATISLAVSVVAAVSLVTHKLTKRAVILLAAIVAVCVLYFIPTALPERVVYHTESMYNSIWVRDDGKRVDLMVNERQAIQSRTYHDKSVFPYDVWTLYLSAPLVAEPKTGRKILLLGLGAGSAALYFNRFFPGDKLVGVEIDSEIIEVGKEYFGLDDIDIRVENADARAFVGQTEELFDVIVVDAFNFPYLPTHLSTVEFMHLLSSKLESGGVVLFNVGRFKDLVSVVDMLTQTGLRAFEYAFQYEVRNQSNTLVYFTNHPIDTRACEKRANDEPLCKIERHVKENITEVARKGGQISTDDRPLTEWLTNRIILQAFGVIQ